MSVLLLVRHDKSYTGWSIIKLSPNPWQINYDEIETLEVVFTDPRTKGIYLSPGHFRRSIFHFYRKLDTFRRIFLREKVPRFVPSPSIKVPASFNYRIFRVAVVLKLEEDPRGHYGKLGEYVGRPFSLYNKGIHFAQSENRLKTVVFSNWNLT